MKKNCAWFFLLVLIAAASLPAASASAYAIAGTTPKMSADLPDSSSYNFNKSLNDLFTPFENFYQSIVESNQTSINVSGNGYVPPNTRLDIGAYFVQADDWIYQKTGFRPSEIFVVALTALSWVLNLLKGGVDWLLGLVQG